MVAWVFTATSGVAADMNILAEIDHSQARLVEFNQLYEQCRKAKIPLDYPTVAKTMLEQFLPLARKDAEGADLVRAGWEAKDFDRALDESIAQMKAFLQEPKLAPDAWRYESGRLEVKGLSFIGNRIDSRQQRDRGPVFFCGYGHFGQVRADLPRWPGYGVNIIQIELGPSGTLVGENEVSLKEAQAICKVLDAAVTNNVMVNILLSPHYFPGWALAKWPELGQGGGNPGYCVDLPQAKFVIEKFLRVVIPMFKDKRALHSFCLANEPNFSRSQDCVNTKALWAAWLKSNHRTIGELNACYGSHYLSFDDVPIPGMDRPEFYDYCVFNEERFAAWHKWMADVIHSMAPQALVHSKIQLEAAVMSRWYHKSSWGIDPELFARDMDLNGNDDIILEPEGGTDWALHWQYQNIGYDIQRSMAAKPIFNSENHPTLDGFRSYVPPERFRTALWQGAIHGQGATTIWVWERGSSPTDWMGGNVMDRPGCAEAVGVTCLDLNRFAREVTALQQVEAPVAIVYSDTSMKPDRRYSQSLETLYTALNFSGIKIDFITQRQLLAGKGREYKWILVPAATELSPEAMAMLARLCLAVAGDGLAKDCYGKATPDELLNRIRLRALYLDAKWSAKKLQPVLAGELARLKVLPKWRMVDADTGQPIWGVEWLPAEVRGHTVINAVNLLNKPVRVNILRGTQTIAAINLLSLGGRDTVATLEPMQPVLARPERN